MKCMGRASPAYSVEGCWEGTLHIVLDVLSLGSHTRRNSQDHLAGEGRGRHEVHGRMLTCLLCRGSVGCWEGMLHIVQQPWSLCSPNRPAHLEVAEGTGGTCCMKYTEGTSPAYPIEGYAVGMNCNSPGSFLNSVAHAELTLSSSSASRRVPRPPPRLP